MCDLTAAAMAASSAVSFVGQQQQADSYNAAARQNAMNASVAASYKYNDAQHRYVYDQTAANKEAYDASMKGRAATAAGIASSGDSGFSGVSLDNLVAASQQQTAENISRIELKRDEARDQYNATTKGAELEAKARSDSMPMKSGPNPLGLAIGMATAGLGTEAGRTQFNNFGKSVWNSIVK